MRALLATALATLLMLAGCSPSASREPVELADAWVQLPVVAGRPAAAFFTLRSRDRGGRLVRLTSRMAGRIELHESRKENGISKMVPIEAVAFDDIGEIVFKPGGNHAMLYGLDPHLKAGMKIPLVFEFQPPHRIETEAEVRAFGADHGSH